MNAQAYFLVPTGKRFFYLTRGHWKGTAPNDTHCSTRCLLSTLEPGQEAPPWPADNSDLWPTECECGHQYSDNDSKGTQEAELFRRTDTGEEMLLNEATPGAIWNAPWLKDFYQPTEDGRILIGICPDGHHWTIDGVASNCDSPCKHCGTPYKDHRAVNDKAPEDKKCKGYEDAKPHKCWVRHGEPPNLTVDKAGVTCKAGAGSIQTPTWHGFLRNGVFEQC